MKITSSIRGHPLLSRSRSVLILSEWLILKARETLLSMWLISTFSSGLNLVFCHTKVYRHPNKPSTQRSQIQERISNLECDKKIRRFISIGLKENREPGIKTSLIPSGIFQAVEIHYWKSDKQWSGQCFVLLMVKASSGQWTCTRFPAMMPSRRL